ncbi:hypothetical protein [Rouxiella sp. Mn2063]|uniref:hypothetical protein n=1 Tax=Rouxiella sp. Mn2063 TaxID=3395262 RepID=UPI003BD63C0C
MGFIDMKKYSLIDYAFLLSVLVFFLGLGDAEAKNNPPTLWQFIDQMSDTIKNTTVNNVDKFPLPVRFLSENEFIKFYKADTHSLADASKISDIDLRLSKNASSMAPFLLFSYSGRCITLNDIKSQYHTVVLTDYPRGRSENEASSYTTPVDSHGQKIAFGFTVKTPDCLSWVSITSDA